MHGIYSRVNRKEGRNWELGIRNSKFGVRKSKVPAPRPNMDRKTGLNQHSSVSALECGCRPDWALGKEREPVTPESYWDVR